MTRRGVLATLMLSAAVVIAAWLAQTSLRTINDLAIGDCFTLPLSGWDGSLSAVEVVDCDGALAAAANDGNVIVAQVAIVGNLAHDSAQPFPGDAASSERSTRWCDQRGGATDLVAVAPGEEGWKAGAPVVCLRLGR
jgi:hypothetical protein